jgi:RecB family endonuclease NucS
MRLVIARCSVDYAGRLTAHLPSAPRLILVKADGSVSIHADDRAYKPLNWMSPPCTLKEGDGEQKDVWTVVNKAGEKLIITMEEVLHDSSHELGVDPGLIKDGVEQLTRYLELLNRDPHLAPVRGIFAAQEIKPQARVLAEDRGIACALVDYDALRGLDDPTERLF